MESLGLTRFPYRPHFDLKGKGKACTTKLKRESARPQFRHPFSLGNQRAHARTRDKKRFPGRIHTPPNLRHISFIYVYLCIDILLYQRVGGESSREIVLCRSCMRAHGGCLLKSGVKTEVAGFPFSLLMQGSFLFPLRDLVRSIGFE